MKRAWWLMLAAAGCHPPARVTARTWIAAGDAAVAQEPARAMANYDRASMTSTSVAERKELATKRATAARAWLTGELAKVPALSLDDGLATVAAIRHALDDAGVKDLETQVVAEEERIAAALWAREVENAHGSSIEVTAYLQTVRAAMPATAVASVAAADAELLAQKRALIARYDAYLVAAGNDHPGARYLWGTVRSALLGQPLLDTQARAQLARELAISTTVGVTGCDAVKRAKLAVDIPGTGPHRAVIHVDVGGCASDERVADRDDKVQTGVQAVDQEEAVPGDCTAACVQNPETGQCDAPECPPQVIHRMVEQPIYTTTHAKVRTLSATLAGTYTVVFDGKQSQQSLQVSTVVEDKAYVDTDGKSHGWPKRTKADVMDQAIREDLPKDIQRVADSLAPLAVTAQVDAARAALAAGDALGAENAIAIAHVAGAAIPPDLAPLAARAGMPWAVWLQVVDGQPVLLQTTAYAMGTSHLRLVQPDDALTHEDARFAEHTTAIDEGVDEHSAWFDVANAGAIEIGAGGDQWRTPGDQTAHGGTLELALRGGGGGGLFYLYQLEGTLDASGAGAVGYDAHARIGVGIRQAWWSAAVLAAGGPGRRGSTDDGVMDHGMPLSAELGAGLELGVGPVANRLTFTTLQLWRPLVDDLDVEQRIRYDLRFAHLTDTGGFGARAWCTFEEADSQDFLLAAGDHTARTCAAALFLLR